MKNQKEFYEMNPLQIWMRTTTGYPGLEGVKDYIKHQKENDWSLDDTIQQTFELNEDLDASLNLEISEETLEFINNSIVGLIKFNWNQK